MRLILSSLLFDFNTIFIILGSPNFSYSKKSTPLFRAPLIASHFIGVDNDIYITWLFILTIGAVITDIDTMGSTIMLVPNSYFLYILLVGITIYTAST